MMGVWEPPQAQDGPGIRNQHVRHDEHGLRFIAAVAVVVPLRRTNGYLTPAALTLHFPTLTIPYSYTTSQPFHPSRQSVVVVAAVVGGLPRVEFCRRRMMIIIKKGGCF